MELNVMRTRLTWGNGVPIRPRPKVTAVEFMNDLVEASWDGRVMAYANAGLYRVVLTMDRPLDALGHDVRFVVVIRPRARPSRRIVSYAGRGTLIESRPLDFRMGERLRFANTLSTVGHTVRRLTA